MSNGSRVWFALTSVLVVLSCVSTRAYAQTPAPTPTPITSLNGVPCTEPEAISADDAFAHEITDARTLAFISLVKDLNYHDRGAVRKRAAAPVATAQIDELDRALAAQCSFAEVDYRTTRLVYIVARIWSASDALDIQGSAHRAIAALLLQDRISEATLAATLAVFGTSEEALDAQIATSLAPPTPAPGTTADPGLCTRTITARAIDPTPPVYPGYARVKGVSGRVIILIDIDKHGFVTSATLYKKDLDPPGEPGADLITQAILSAGTTHYLPQFADCKPLPGRYLFQADFNRGR